MNRAKRPVLERPPGARRRGARSRTDRPARGSDKRNVLLRVSWPPSGVFCGNPRILPYTSPSPPWSDAFSSSARPTANPAVWWSWSTPEACPSRVHTKTHSQTTRGRGFASADYTGRSEVRTNDTGHPQKRRERQIRKLLRRRSRTLEGIGFSRKNDGSIGALYCWCSADGRVRAGRCGETRSSGARVRNTHKSQT